MRVVGPGGISINRAIFIPHAACVGLTRKDHPGFQKALPLFEEGHSLFGKYIPSASLARPFEPFHSFTPTRVEGSLKALKAQNALLHSPKRDIEKYCLKKAAKAKTAYENTLYSLTSQQVDNRIAQLEQGGLPSQSPAYAYTYWLLAHNRPIRPPKPAPPMSAALVKPVGSEDLNNYGNAVKKAIEEAKEKLEAFFVERIIGNENEGQRKLPMKELCEEVALIDRIRPKVKEALRSLWQCPELLLHPPKEVHIRRTIDEIAPSALGDEADSVEDCTKSIWLSTDYLRLPFEQLLGEQEAFFTHIESQKEQARKDWEDLTAWFSTAKALISFIPIVGPGIVRVFEIPFPHMARWEAKKAEQFDKENLIRIQLKNEILPAIIKALKGKGVLKMSGNQVTDITSSFKSSISASQDTLMTAFNKGSQKLAEQITTEVLDAMQQRPRSPSPVENEVKVLQKTVEEQSQQISELNGKMDIIIKMLAKNQNINNMG